MIVRRRPPGRPGAPYRRRVAIPSAGSGVKPGYLAHMGVGFAFLIGMVLTGLALWR